MKKISILMPVYNAEKYLKDSLESIINQTYSNWELIVIIESETTDNTKRLVELYQKKDRRIKIIENKNKKGIAESLNIGLKECTGEYIARMDADDISLNNRLKTQYEFMEKNPEIDILTSNSEYFGDVKGPWFEGNISFEELKVNLLISNPICHPTVFFRRKSIEEHNLKYNNDYISEDYELWCNAIIKGCKIHILSDILLHYRKNNDNTTSNDKFTKKRIKSCVKTLKNYYKAMLNLNLSTKEIMNLQILFNYKKSLRIKRRLVIKIIKRNKKLKKFDEKLLTYILGYYSLI